MMTATSTRELLDWLRATTPSAQLTLDSRRVSPGDVFFACRHESGDSRNYIAQAIEAGASAVVLDDADGFVWRDEWSVQYQIITGLAQQIGRIAHDWYGRPDIEMFSVAVTGTNGKTSCTQWLGQALSRHGMPTAVIGTLGIGLYRDGHSGPFTDTGYTTPDPLQLYRQLAERKLEGARAIAIEASSIGLAQHRIDELHVDCAVLTNFTRDHLDFHGTMQAYEQAKTRLFDWQGLKHAVINLDDPMGVRLIAHLRKTHPATQIVGYSVEGAQIEGIALLTATDIRTTQHGSSFQLHTAHGSGTVRTHLIGRFNVSNALAIAAVLLTRDMAFAQVVSLLESLQAVPGRMQQLGGADTPLVVIDYAHTPDALQKVLDTLRPVADARHGALWCVFGCGGDRDPGKRPQMGLAADHADHIMVTSDNPRSEDPSHIIAQIVEGVPQAQRTKLQIIEDRATAILSAIRHAGKQDVILLAGKGHEAYQEVKGRRLAFRDADHAALALATCATRHGGH
ncbi:MAG: UDP-N-acetylmuramoyl-L-alanyl-D-glutamate--2,6-diaminopimelate ligase [Betaproteobacteria bacterium]